MRKTLLAISILALSACQTQAPPRAVYVNHDAFNEDEYRWSKESGTGEIAGQAFLKTRGGDVKTCAGNTVWLVPDTKYTRDAAAAALSGSWGSISHHAYYYQYRRQGQCDASGRFVYRNLPAGNWLIEARVNWEAPSQLGGLTQQGGLLYKTVALAAGEKAEVIMAEGGKAP